MKWQKYGTNSELDLMVDSDNINNRCKMAEQGYGLDKLIDDECYDVYEACTLSSFWPEFCADNWKTLINHKYPDIRAAVAEQRYSLDTLIDDEHWLVRSAVAEQGYGLIKLIHDTHRCVRYIVAEQGYGLNKLINDDSRYVRNAVKNYLNENNYKSIDDWVNQNQDKIYY